MIYEIELLHHLACYTTSDILHFRAFEWVLCESGNFGIHF